MVARIALDARRNAMAESIGLARQAFKSARDGTI
jgi:DNA-binding XRE family transcriptional regulator